MNQFHLILLMVGIVGIITCACSLYMGYYFWKKEHKMGLHNDNPNRRFRQWIDELQEKEREKWKKS